MEKIKSLADLKKKREDLQSNLKLRELGDNVDNLIQVKVAMATCGIASGAKQVMEVIINECNKRNLPVVVTQTGCMGYCYAEPTVEVKKPGQEAVVFGYITPAKAEELVNKYLAGNELLDGIIPVNYEKIDNK
ncbi:MAG TPA: (2Fe-2S) ferredoxin domain-containing protein [Bacteroidales bacterium]|jgi:NADP-reducing hydrogenase subunit HndB|nr:(2Fe-2S) ferredoxin domain-containing protein [Bacteroidales bacterium]HNW67233.1 (2Fe-2S) ferredoxin domain-containing protein [Bacteroidales bacterium]HPT52132.1 (2Fe-2S) ferredoxin domain-containing protein [Bacteroidales bacterium]